MTRKRVLVVEDSLTVRKRLVEVLAADPELEVIAEADDGQAGAQLCERLRPDVITMDMMLPVMTGVDATEYIMAYCPTPILIVSASTNRGELFRTYDALAAGAVDVLDKPTGDEPDDDWEHRLVSAVKMVARIKVITHVRGRLSAGRRDGPVAGDATSTARPLATATNAPRALAIGVSTGGPGALVQLFQALPPDFPLPIVLVIHIGLAFAPALAEWLDGLSPLRVSAVRDGEPLPPTGQGRILMAAHDRHVELRHGRLWLTDAPERHSCRPSVDVLFESFAKDLGNTSAACLLTGMGRDGAEGLLAVKRAGGRTIAQDESTSVVFGMPREAIRLDAAQQVLPLPEIAPALISLAHSRAPRGMA